MEPIKKMVNQFEIKDSGKRRDFNTGAKRDIDYNKPRFDLIPTTVLFKILDSHEQVNYSEPRYKAIDGQTKARLWSLGFLWGHRPNDQLLLEIIWIILKCINLQEDDNILVTDDSIYPRIQLISQKTYLRIANHYGNGAKKYDPWNWSKGMPFSVFYASLMRHIFAVTQDQDDEDHLSAVFFNAACILHFSIIGRTDLDDITPRLEEQKSHQKQLICDEKISF